MALHMPVRLKSLLVELEDINVIVFETLSLPETCCHMKIIYDSFIVESYFCIFCSWHMNAPVYCGIM